MIDGNDNYIREGDLIGNDEEEDNEHTEPSQIVDKIVT